MEPKKRPKSGFFALGIARRFFAVFWDQNRRKKNVLAGGLLHACKLGAEASLITGGLPDVWCGAAAFAASSRSIRFPRVEPGSESRRDQAAGSMKR